jgi:hypothetical protein
MRLIGLAVVLAASVILSARAAEAQGPGRVPRIGLLVIDTCALPLARAKARECDKRAGCGPTPN